MSNPHKRPGPEFVISPDQQARGLHWAVVFIDYLCLCLRSCFLQPYFPLLPGPNYSIVFSASPSLRYGRLDGTSCSGSFHPPLAFEFMFLTGLLPLATALAALSALNQIAVLETMLPRFFISRGQQQLQVLDSYIPRLSITICLSISPPRTCRIHRPSAAPLHTCPRHTPSHS